MRTLTTNQIKQISGGLEGQLTAHLSYGLPWDYTTEQPNVMISYSVEITGPADEILFKIKSGDYPKFVEGYEDLKISHIFISTP